MNARSVSSVSLNLLRLMLQVNFNASVLFLLIASVLSMAGSELFFDNSSDLYGPLANNLRLVLLYLCLVQLAVYGFYQMSNNYAAVVFLGAFLLILILSLEFYCTVNQIEIDPNYRQLLLYAGLSHVLYGGICILPKNGG
ncbi:hypothetical protein IVG45_05505 [Methylomonas sp. LL1]|uniref:hypothetical protein n=1 Tax=Methylomonas sp. LL1 TaxID=2785785 RepID=UPI0018C3BC7D|nr:hypothetical protein [Methylomonas sp. LL1]QPK64422.1 hypothetical protein IVG45_05505 [Methylomonas sp. LL1]CAG1022015.1 hypothetical protein MTYM_01427 [Methylococcales bacterium]